MTFLWLLSGLEKKRQFDQVRCCVPFGLPVALTGPARLQVNLWHLCG